MSDQIYYCFRNGTRRREEQIKQSLEKEGIDISFVPSYCMKLCMFCDHQHIAILNQEILIAKDEDKFIQLIISRLKNEQKP